MASCRAFLESNLPRGWKPEQVTVDVISEPEVSGEIADRPGINQVWPGIESKRWDLILAEKSSRLYRHQTKVGELFESAVDAGTRAICPPDVIDTSDEDWTDRLHMCQTQQNRSNFYMRKRIERAHDGLWARGAPMYSYGKTDGSFRCSASATGKCWIRVYCLRERVYPAVVEAVVNEVLSLDGVRDAVLARSARRQRRRTSCR